MNITDDQLEKIRKISAEWNVAEQDIKIAEQVCTNVVIPAVKELRYAGRRIVDAICCIDESGSNEDIEKYLTDAYFDCVRVRHDAIDVATASMAKTMEVMTNKLGYDVILKVYSKFPLLVGRIDALRQKIATSRKNRTERNNIYSNIETEELPNIVAEFREMMSGEPMMKSLAGSERKYKAIAVVGFFLSVVGFGKDFFPWKEWVGISIPAAASSTKSPDWPPMLTLSPLADIPHNQPLKKN